MTKYEQDFSAAVKRLKSKVGKDAASDILDAIHINARIDVYFSSRDRTVSKRALYRLMTERILALHH